MVAETTRLGLHPKRVLQMVKSFIVGIACRFLFVSSLKVSVSRHYW